MTGGCMCGGVRWELSRQPVSTGYCHCTRCQRRTGTSGSFSANIVPGTLRVTQGEELVRAYDPGDGGWHKVFCSACGSALWSESPDGSQQSIRMGSFDEDPGVPASYRQFVAYAATWEALPEDGVPRYPERRPAS